MLKWLARKEDKEAPLGITLWNLYVIKYGDQHPAQSLNGRYGRWLLISDRITDTIRMSRERLTGSYRLIRSLKSRNLGDF